MDKQYKTFPFIINETKEIDDNGQKYGIVKGYAATYGNIDRGGDMILSGAFTKSLDEYRQKNRPLKMHYQHSGFDIIGGFPIDKIKEDDKGLFVEGYINLNVQRGKEAYALAKQGVLTDFSIGYSINDQEQANGINLLKELTLWETSLVGEPMNTEAVVTEVKTVAPYQNLPLASQDRSWDSSAATKRVRSFTNSDDAPGANYKKAFFWYDGANSDNFTAYKLPYADVVNGKLMAIPRGIFAAAGAIEGARGGVDLPDADRAGVISNINKYYKKMGLESPIGKSYDGENNGEDNNCEDDKEMEKVKQNFPTIETIRDVESVLKERGFSNSQSKILIAKIKEFSAVSCDDCPDDNADDREEHSNGELEINSKLNDIIKLLKR